MCSLRCQADSGSCEASCEQQRDHEIVQAGGTAIGSSSSSGQLLGGMIAAVDTIAAAKGVPPPGMDRLAKPFSMQGVGASGATSSKASGHCDDSSEAREIEAINARIEADTRGMGIPRIQCYAAQQYVRITELQLRVAMRCNIEIAESQTELKKMREQERKLCQEIK